MSRDSNACTGAHALNQAIPSASGQRHSEQRLLVRRGAGPILCVGCGGWWCMHDDLVEEDEAGEATEPHGEELAAGLTVEAQDLIARADEGGVPMFTSANLARIALENGVVVTEDMTPNAIIDELRLRAR